MFIGFLCSPALCSIATFLFGINAIRDVHPRKWLEQKWWLLGLLWVAFYAVTWFYSDDKAEWGRRLQTKLPFLILPLAFAFLPRFTPKQVQLIVIVIGTTLLFGAIYSVSFLVGHTEFYNHEYGSAHLLPTPVRGDYIRFSLSIVLYIVYAIYSWRFLESKVVKATLILLIALLFIYLHILAAKSGLVSLYIFIILWVFYLVFTKKWYFSVILATTIMILVVLAYSCIPTFATRLRYTVYSIQMYQAGDRTGRYGDEARLMSFNVARRLIMRHPWTGIGTGDMQNEMRSEYPKWYPEVEEQNRLLPHNQFLIVALGCGIPVLFLFIIWFVTPLTLMRRNRESFYFLTVWLLLFVQLMIEPALEVQYGVFVFLFYLLMMRHALIIKNRQKCKPERKI